MDKIDGFDAAVYQKELVYSQIPSSVKFCIGKCTEGSTGDDILFQYHRANCASKGIGFMAYHFFHGSVDVDAQIDNFLFHVGNVAGPYWIDIENRSDDGMIRREVVKKAILMGKRLRQQTGRLVGYYTSPGYWNGSYGSGFGDPLLDFLLWEAAWINWPYIANGYPPKVAGFANLPVVWQYAVKTIWGDKVDCDWFLGTQEELDNMINDVTVEPPPAPPLPDFCTLPKATVITTAGLRIRSLPSDTAPILSVVNYGKQVEVKRVVTNVSGDQWAEVGVNQYMAYCYKGAYLLKF